MIFEQLEHLLTEQGFNKIPSNLPEFTFFFRNENTYVNVLYVIDYVQSLYITQDQYRHVRNQIMGFFNAKGIKDVHVLSLILCADMNKARQICEQDRFSWVIDTVNNRLLIYENQISDFYGMKGILENFLFNLPEVPSGENDRKEAADNNCNNIIDRKIIPWVNITLVIINIVLYVVCTFTGDMLYNIGTFGVMDIIENGEWYRLLTNIFLHADIQHLVNNMLILYYIGNVVEKSVGHLPYALIYFLSGLSGDVFSAGYELFTGNYVSSLGASGAVFGVEGAMLMLAILNKGKITEITAGRIAFVIAFSLYCGFTSSYVNNMAHIGGVLMGFAAAGVLWLFSGIRKGS